MTFAQHSRTCQAQIGKVTAVTCGLGSFHEPEQTACPKSANDTCASCYTGLVLYVLELAASNSKEFRHMQTLNLPFFHPYPVFRKLASCVMVQEQWKDHFLITFKTSSIFFHLYLFRNNQYTNQTHLSTEYFLWMFLKQPRAYCWFEMS